ncbi:uncharacterized protein LOC131426431 [Malaya genurostris]|uniref:uncharacterized protein LOC131426431 n=1 Tax=Malaya genurostris TaxID=325434 RepID=UPI0026F3ABEF|nr:uncharacterized protein LOC131426431 [Malaya genurostris]XP_058445127.1 uncharacterized protein LOC131426431 [Malaya genurostris]
MGTWLYLLAIPTLAVLASGNREHKVHNIVLYPDKHSWCTTRNISQVISHPGCKQVTIDNNVCVGACFSYSIPHTEPSDPGEVLGPYCDSCQPESETIWHNVTLDCSENSNLNGDEEAKPTVLVKRVQIIKNCSCTSCEKQSDKKHQQHHHHHHEEPIQVVQVQSTTASLIQNDIPELLEVVHFSENDTEPVHHSPVHSHQSGSHGTTYLQQHHLNHYEHHSHTDNVKKLLHQKISGLLKSIQETNSKQDRQELVDMIKLIKGSSDRNWDALVDSLKSENTILDIERLRTELELEEDPAEFHPQPKTPEQEDHERLLKHQFDILSPHASSVEQHPQHHHVAGERLDQHHHLERGPHGALVIGSDEDDAVSRMNHGHEITEKINIHPHELKPNHAGTILTYDNHHSEHPSGNGGGTHHRHHPHHHQHHHNDAARHHDDDSQVKSN